MSRLKSFHIICCICCLGFFEPAARSQNADINLLKSINPDNPSAVFWKATSGSYILVSGTASLGSLAAAFITNNRDLKHKSYELLMGIGINIVATEALKRVVNRTRPADQYPIDVFVSTNTKGYSFPSGHTSLAFATATSLTLTHKKWYVAVPAYLWAGCVGYSRMYLGKHYPSDVLGGAVVGAGSSLLSHWISKRIFPAKQETLSSANGF